MGVKAKMREEALMKQRNAAQSSESSRKQVEIDQIQKRLSEMRRTIYEVRTSCLFFLLALKVHILSFKREKGRPLHLIFFLLVETNRLYFHFLIFKD